MLFAFITIPASVVSAQAPRPAQIAGPISLTPAQTAAVARAFAPILVFHPLEHYFPTSSMFVLGADPVPSGVQEIDADDPAAFRAGLESWPSRVAAYRALSLAEKVRRAALQYRVFTRVDGAQTEIVVEYWCYYVYNEFTVRGTWLPYRVRDNHPHDLERLYLVLTASDAGISVGGSDETWARSAFRIRRVVANAHDGSIPPNQYDVHDGEVLAPPLTVLVELGSHAMAPDINHDGRFTPGIDSTAARKLQWGIRDTGATGSRYRASFMDDRDASALRLCGPAGAPPAEIDPCTPYALYPADDLQTWFQGFDLTSRDRHDILGRSSWWVRTFGDVRLETLMVPADPPDGSVMDRMVRRRIRGQAGFVMGLTGVDGSPSLVLGRRYFWNVAPRRAPDIAAEAVVLFPLDRSPLVEGTVWGSYTVDAITNLIVGGGWFAEGQAADFAVGSDLRVGRFTVRPTWRVRESLLNVRVTKTF